MSGVRRSFAVRLGAASFWNKKIFASSWKFNLDLPSSKEAAARETRQKGNLKLAHGQKQRPNACLRWTENIQTIIDEKGTWPAIVRASRVKDVVADIAQSHQVRLNANRHNKLLRA
jgi:hypothetical protein